MRVTLLVLVITSCFLAAQSQNLVDSDSWTVGSGPVGSFYLNGTESENIREMGVGPHGEQTILWKAEPDGDGQADGGWETEWFSVDRNKMYRFSVWIKKTNSHDGTTYFGCYSDDILTLSGNVNSNPYFWAGDLPELNKWYLLVGYIHASDDASTSSYGGVYDGVTGAKVISCTDFKFSSSATISRHRTYLYYDPNTANRQFFYGPEVYLVESNQPLNEFNISTKFNGDAFFTKEVGVGTTSARGRFDVDGPGDIYLSDDPVGGSLQSVFLAGHVYLSPYKHTGVSYLQARRADDSGTTSLRLRTYNNGTLTESMHITGDGRVGIGTTAPSEKLTVNGTIYGKEIKVDLSVPGPDYVFEETYDLPSLKEVEEFINHNKHLPEVPSAIEMQRKGIKVGEMNMLLLKKVEELTLYIIEQQKEIERLNGQLWTVKEELSMLRRNTDVSTELETK